jgi:DNA-binding MurR/RpiR family transcriptional regulator
MSDVWQFNEAVSLLREARRIYVTHEARQR